MSVSPAHPLPRTTESADALAAGFAASYSGVVAFIAVVSEGSFAKAGDRLGVGRSAVSRSVQKLEEQLGARLFFRTTRSTSLTGEGEWFYANCRPGVERIVQAVAGMRELREGPPRGRLRVSSAVSFGRTVIAPLLTGFQAEYPDISVDLLLADRTPDFAAEHVDIAFRDGRIERSQVIAKRLFPLQLSVCASPDYAAQYGLPRNVEELAEHRSINYRLASGRVREWEFKVDGQPKKVLPPGKTSFNDADLVLQAVLDGRGIAQLAGYQICALLQSRQLVTCLSQYAPDDRGHYLCYPSREQLPPRVRVFIDYMTVHVRARLESSMQKLHDNPRVNGAVASEPP